MPIPSRSNLLLRSGEVSKSKFPSGKPKMAPERVRLFLGSGLVQTEQSHPMLGTPTLVPTPSKIICPRKSIVRKCLSTAANPSREKRGKPRAILDGHPQCRLASVLEFRVSRQAERRTDRVTVPIFVAIATSAFFLSGDPPAADEPQLIQAIKQQDALSLITVHGAGMWP